MDLGPDHWILLRHGEKPDAARGIAGVDERGSRDPLSLSVRGWQRAGALATLLATGARAEEGLATPRTLMAAVDPGRSSRPRLTVQVIAGALGLPVDTRFGSEGDPAALLRAAADFRGPVLVSWRHLGLPVLARAIAGEGVAPAAWPEDCYDRVWVLRREGKYWRCDNLPLRLLAGDAAE